MALDGYFCRKNEGMNEVLEQYVRRSQSQKHHPEDQGCNQNGIHGIISQRAFASLRRLI
jgi:hypothetical protein